MPSPEPRLAPQPIALPPALSVSRPLETPAPAPGEAVAVAPGVLWARMPLPMARLDHVNVYALEDGPGWTLVDTGLDWDRGREALAALRAGPLGGRPVSRVILTHHHPDHIGLAGALAAEGAEIRASRIAWLTGRMLTLDRIERPTPEQLSYRRRAGMAPEALAAYAAERPYNFGDGVGLLPLGLRALAEGERLEIGGRGWVVRLAEGHSPGAVTLWSSDGLMIAGDQVLPGISPNIGVWPTEPEADPLSGFLHSCRRLAALGGDPLVLPGHRQPFRGLTLRLTQLIENHEQALARTLAALAERPHTAEDLFAPLYRRPIGAGEYPLALAEALAHANHLWRSGRARRTLDEGGAWRFSATKAVSRP